MRRGSDSGFDRFDDFDHNKGRPVLITAAEPSYEEQYRARVRKYLTLMAFRAPALILAALAYGAWHNGLISLLIVGASVPLPWMAVLIANDRPPRRRPNGRPPRRGTHRNRHRARRAAGTTPVPGPFRPSGRNPHFSEHSQVTVTSPHVTACEIAERWELNGLICRLTT
ncbi:DUF3099 domain-containing protein [Mycobacterium tilburgii]|uniref:DUF3099 domain-containing protein n=1 Tax=Mycobacterium tilburgii TaxID=44467 RepID=UPI003898D823